MPLGGSSNGRTTVFGAVYRGSSPCPPAREICRPLGGFLVLGYRRRFLKESVARIQIPVRY